MLTRAYEGASQKDGWRPRRAGASANTDHLADGAILRTRARALVQNVPYIARGLESLVANTIGTGITPRSLSPSGDKIDALWADWAKVADADGKSDLYGLQAMAYRAMEQDGEVLIRLRARRLEDGLPVPLQIQVLEIDWLDSSKMGANGTNTIMNGVEYDVLGKIVAEYEKLGAEGGSILGRKIVEVITVNGARVHLEDGSWVLVRASSNKPELVVVVESMRSEDDMRDLFRKEIKPRLAAYPEIGAFNQEI